MSAARRARTACPNLFRLPAWQRLLTLFALLLALTVPATPATAADSALPPDTARLHFHRDNNDYTGWGLHVWGPGLALERDITWEHPLTPSGVDAYGVYFDLPLKPEARSIGFVIHRGETKSVPQDLELDLTRHGREAWLLENSATVFTAPPAIDKDFAIGLETATRERSNLQLRWLAVAFGAALLLGAWGLSQRRLSTTRHQLATQVGLLVQAQESLREQAERGVAGADDELTGLPTRGGLQKTLDLALSRARRSGNRVAVMFIDLDGFKEVNDNAGHDAGDTVLRTLAQRFRSVLRESDTVARMGGDEFVAVLENLGDGLDALSPARSLLAKAAEPVQTANGSCQVGASIGVAVYPGDAEDGASLLKRADTAMYEAKRAGKNACRFAEARLQARAEERLRGEEALQQALESNAVELELAPEIALADGRILGAEIRPHWQRPATGISAGMLPDEEHSELAHSLNCWMLDQALAQAGAATGGATPPRFIVRLAGEPGAALALAVDRLSGRSHGAAITLELPPSVLEPRRRLAETAVRLRELDVGLAIGRMGLQDLNLLHLTALPLAHVALDVEALAGADAGHVRSFARSLVALGRIHGFRVLVVGPDANTLRDWARRLDCDTGLATRQVLAPAQWQAALAKGSASV